MPTPEEVLEDVMRLKWPGSISEQNYGLVIATMMGFADLLRLPGEKPRQRRMRKAVEANQKAAEEKAPLHGKSAGQDALRKRLMEGPLTIKEALAVTGHSVNTTTYASLQRIGAKPFIGSDGIKRWALPGDGRPARRKNKAKVRRPSFVQDEIRGAVAKALAPGLPVNLGKLRGELGCSKDVILKVVREMGAKQSGVGPHTRWTLPLPKHVNGIEQIEMEVRA